jgi:SpoVK/Ycf46/Vps4 family AAA+-type ATPase
MFNKKFNFETDSKTQLHKVGDSAVFYLNNPKEMLDIITNDEDVILDDSSYGEKGSGGIFSSRLKMREATTSNGKGIIYEGSISYDTNVAISNNSFFRVLKEELSDDFNVSDLYFNNKRLLSSQSSEDLAAVSLYRKGLLKYSNYTTGYTPSRRVAVSTLPPTYEQLEKMPDGAEQYLSDTIKGYIFTLNALALAISDKRANTIFVMTPSGPQYPAAEKRDEITLKHLTPVQVKGPEIDIYEEVVTPEQPKILLDDIGGLEEVREELRQVAVSFKHPDLMKKWGALRPQGVLLYGPPGSGKTSLATALANEINGELWEVKATDIYDKWLGNSEKNIQKIFDDAKRITKPTVLFLDEFDALIPSSDAQPSRNIASVIGIFKREMSNLREQNSNIIVVAATNHEDRIDESLIRAGRFDVKSYVGLPDSKARTQIFINQIADAINTLRSENFDPFSTDINMVHLGQIADGMSGADISEIIRKLSFKKAMEEARTGSTTPITHEEMVATIQSYRK